MRLALLFTLLLGGCSLDKADVPRRDSEADAGRPTSACEPCDPLGQTGCEAGLDCHIGPYFADEPAVCEAPGSATRSQDCVPTPDTCAAGLACTSGAWGCLPLCTEDADCAEPGEVCIELSDMACVGVCSQACSVLNQTGCDFPGRPACGPVTGGLPRGNLCRRVTDDLSEGESCVDFQQCGAGLGCFGRIAEEGICRAIEDCGDIAVPGDCSADGVADIGEDPDGTPLCLCLD